MPSPTSRYLTNIRSYLQIAEALGRPSELKEFGAARHERPWAGRLEEGWQVYRRTIERVLTSNYRQCNSRRR